MNKSLKTIVLIIQIGGGLLGLALIGRSLMTEQLSRTAMIIHVAFIHVFLFGIVAGIALVKKPKLGLRLSTVFQAMQVPFFIGPTAAYTLVSGASLNLCQHTTGYRYNFIFGSRYYFAIQSRESWLVGINLIALVFFLLLVREIWFEIRFLNIRGSRLNKHPSQQFSQTQNHHTCGSPLRHILR